jgi:ABC-2 type transport system permease protein
MLRTIFLKTLYEKRFSLLGWLIAIIALTALTVVFFPTLKDSFAESLKDVPESMQAFIGDASAYQTLAGFVDLQVISQMVFLTLIMGVILGSGLLAGDEGKGTLQSLLAQPVKRQKVFIQKYAAMLVLILIACLAIFVGTYISAYFINETMNWFRLFQATIGVWLITVVFSVLAFSIGAITGSRGLAGTVAGMMAFIAYLITSLAVGVKQLRAIDVISPFHYFNTPSIIANGFDWGNIAVLATILVVVTGLGYFAFIKRDIQ